MRLADINFSDESCCFDPIYCFEFEGKTYEVLDARFLHLDGSRPVTNFRVVLGVDDYDYVEDVELGRRLDAYIVAQASPYS